MNFGEALDELHDGAYVARESWNVAGMWVALQRPDDKSKMTQPYLYTRGSDGGLVPWVASQGDLLADDWQVVGHDVQGESPF